MHSISELLRKLGSKEHRYCMPARAVAYRIMKIKNFDKEFLEFKKIAKEFSMTIIPGAFYQTAKAKTSIISPVIGPKGEFIGTTRENPSLLIMKKNNIKPGKEAKIFDTACKFGDSDLL